MKSALKSPSLASLPLLGSFEPDQTFFITPDGEVSQRRFLCAAWAISRTLPKRNYLLNLCNDRYLFALTFAAALIRGIVSLLPPNRLAATCHDIMGDYPGSHCIADIPVEGIAPRDQTIIVPPSFDQVILELPLIESDRLAFIAFTSGSTSRPKPQPKYWGDLVGCAHAGARRFGFGPERSIVATVPPQHMYGLELSILVPLVTGIRVSSERPFFPADLQTTLARVPGPRVLITTPVHLRACVDAELKLPVLDMVVSATAPLPLELAKRAECLWSTKILEIYGTTESGSIASRETCRDQLWCWYDGVQASRNEEIVSVSAPFIHGLVPLADVIEDEPDGRFRLVGRTDEIIKVGGKRASLKELNQRLNAISGCVDAVFVPPDLDRDADGRLGVVAVAPGLDRRAIIAGLAGWIDPVFYPRRVVFVDRLPRNEAGKVTREALHQILSTHGMGSLDAN